MPEDWLRRQFDWLENNHAWLTPQHRLKKWQSIVRIRWSNDRAGWQSKKTPATDEALDVIDAELQWCKDSVRRAELNKQRAKLIAA